MEPVKEASSTFRPGTLLGGKYRIEREVGQGGLGVVLAATHVGLDQRVAVKHLHPRALGSRVLVERFVREARLLGKLCSDHVVRVHDVGSTPEGVPYIVMEYLEGEDLSTMLERGPLTVPQAIELVAQACEGLAQAHALGIVHRDLKPENIFVVRGAGAPVVKLLDFGISRLDEKGREDRRLTLATDRFGTPEYMSPEQINSSASADARSDIWSLGVILHELLTGKRPFAGESHAELFASIVGQRYAGLRAECPEAPPELEAIVAKCLEKRPNERLASAADLARALEVLRRPVRSALSISPKVSLARQSVSAVSLEPEPTTGVRPCVRTVPAHPPVRTRSGRPFSFVAAGAATALLLTLPLAWIRPALALRATVADRESRHVEVATGLGASESSCPEELPAAAAAPERAARRAGVWRRK